MGKALKVLVIVLLLLSIIAVVLATMVYGKRSEVIARNQVLTAGYVKLAPTIEDKPAEPPEQKDNFPGRDVSPLTPEFIDKNPDMSDFWDKSKYSTVMEQNALSTLDLKNNRDLLSLYKRNALGEIEKDPTTGEKLTSGDGTMQAVLDNLYSKSKTQMEKLGESRAMLQVVRQELVDTITEYNKTKVEFRKRVKELADTKDELEKTAAELATMKPKVEAAEKAAKEASDRATDMEAQKNRADDKIRELEIDLKKRDDEIKKLRSMQGQAQPEAGTQVVQFNFTPGQKGKVIAVNEKWNYALIELDEAFLKEAMGDDLTQPAKPAPNGVTMSLKRTEKNGEVFVTKVKLMQIRPKIGRASCRERV